MLYDQLCCLDLTRPQSVRTRTWTQTRWTQLHHLIIYVRSVLSYSTYFLSVLLFDCLYSLFRQVFTVLVDLLYYKNSSGSCSDNNAIHAKIYHLAHFRSFLGENATRTPLCTFARRKTSPSTPPRNDQTDMF